MAYGAGRKRLMWRPEKAKEYVYCLCDAIDSVAYGHSHATTPDPLSTATIAELCNNMSPVAGVVNMTATDLVFLKTTPFTLQNLHPRAPTLSLESSES